MSSNAFSISAAHVSVSATSSMGPIVPFVPLSAGGVLALTMSLFTAKRFGPANMALLFGIVLAVGTALVTLPIREVAARQAEVAA